MEEKYSRLGDLKKRVIEPAVAEINEHSNFWVTYGQRKVGRIVTHFQFQFGLKGKPQDRKALLEEEMNRQVKSNENDESEDQRESMGQPLLERKRNFAEMKKILG